MSTDSNKSGRSWQRCIEIINFTRQSIGVLNESSCSIEPRDLEAVSMKKRFLFSLTLPAMLLVSACSQKAAQLDEIRFRLPGDPPSIDWTLATDNVSKEVLVNLQDGLLEQGADSKIKTAMAESYTISPDGKTYTFVLHNEIKWSDGQALTAQHYVDSWERLLNPKTASEYAYFLFDITGAEDYQKGKITDFTKVGVKATDARTLVVTLRSPVAYWIYIPSFWVTYPIRKDVVAQWGDKWTDPSHIVTAGAYTLKSFERESKIILDRNPSYYRFNAESPSRLVFRVVKEDSTAISLFNNKDLDIIRDLPPIQISTLSKRAEFVASPFLRGYYIGFNVKDPQVADPKVRMALGHAIDRTELQKVLGSMVTPSKSWNQPGLLGYSADRGLDFNPELAKKLWSEAKSKPTTFEFWFDQKEMNKIIAENIQNQWKRNLGIDVKLVSQEWKVYLKTIQSHPPAVWRMGWGADYPDPDTFMNLFTCGSGNNFTKFCSAKYDDLIRQAASGTKDEVRAKFYGDAEKLLLEDEAVIIPILTPTNMHLVSPRVKGFAVNPMGDMSLKDMRISRQ